MSRDAGPPAEADQVSLGLDLAAPRPRADVAGPYRVLARKYRPSTFADLIGQEAMVRTLSNAFETSRIHQAYLLTGVRGVGKTTTARILARAFNYEVPGKADRPTINMPELGVHCQAIIESRHMDVIEMDAASHTGIDDVRELIEGARYRPVSARTKVYIIDEVHMLSKAAFNGLLKTLEEPPEHVKFVFATTEIEKVPVTVRSRCQRFDLRRVDADVLVRHLAGICVKEEVAVEEAALALIARAAEGSVRDALSLLDQAIAYGSQGPGARGVEAATVQVMLGLADRARIIDLFEAVMKGDIGTALSVLKGQYDQGADPGQILAEVAEFVHFVTRLKLVPETAKDPSITQEERERGKAFSAALPLRVLARAWQILLKGLQEVKDSPRPLAAADMVLVRLAHAADLPTPDEALRALTQSPGGPEPAPPAAASRGAPAQTAPAPRTSLQNASAQGAVAFAQARAEPDAGVPKMRLASFEDVVALAHGRRDPMLKMALERDVRLVRFEEGRIEFALAPGTSPLLAQTLMRRLQEWTGTRWMVAIASAEGAPTLKEQAEASERERWRGVKADPLVRSVLDRFPGAEIVAVRSNVPPAAEASDAPDQDADVTYSDDLVTGDDL
ncbi:MAG: DNA polymerase III subunit gamma/tau [Methylobacteriaceae bacterium]|nr:DNA polymerase III subunit gamma/tau [Methylobacteriaceae bacterium]